MGAKPRVIGDEHVKCVHQALKKSIKKEDIVHYPETVKKTVNYILDLYPNIISVTSKFDESNSDQAKDLTLYFANKDKVSVNLFIIKKGRRIQPKNPGAKSFFTKYFLDDQLQTKFNIEYEKIHFQYLKDLLRHKLGSHYVSDKRELRKLISTYFPHFSDDINIFRENFLYSLRETCFILLKDHFNKKDTGFLNAYNMFFLVEDVNIITSYGNKIDDVMVKEFDPGKPSFSDIDLYKVGKNTVGIKYGDVALTLRFKFESSPVSSIKLASSFDKLSNELEKQQTNIKTIRKMQDLYSNHVYNSNSNSSNAIGKCHEAITYYYFLKGDPNILQVEPDECVGLFNKYFQLVKSDTLEKLFSSTAMLVPTIMKKLYEKYNKFKIESIELVPDGYLNDRLDTGDLQLILKVKDSYMVEKISLKATSKKSNKITTKNPGIGTILGSTYFNLGNIDNLVKEVKSKFEVGEINHKESLEKLSTVLGDRLKNASQKQLKQGIENLLGKSIMAVTFYDENHNYCKEPSKIVSTINVYVNTPSTIQSTLAWNNDLDIICLRVKFSRGQNYGWSSIKLVSEYQIK